MVPMLVVLFFVFLELRGRVLAAPETLLEPCKQRVLE